MTSTILAASSHGAPRFGVALIPVLVIIAAFDVYCLVDLVRARSVRHLPKVVWALIIVFISSPIGGVVYLFAGRDRNAENRAG